MREHEPTDKRPESEVMLAEILQYLKDADFGSPKWRAFYDVYDSYKLEKEQFRLIRELTSEDSQAHKDPMEKGVKESKLRIVEQEIALLNRQMQTNTVTIPGYEDEYWKVDGRFGDLGFQYVQEGEMVYPNNPKAARNEYESNLFQAYIKASEELWSHQGKIMPDNPTDEPSI